MTNDSSFCILFNWNLFSFVLDIFISNFSLSSTSKNKTGQSKYYMLVIDWSILLFLNFCNCTPLALYLSIYIFPKKVQSKFLLMNAYNASALCELRCLIYLNNKYNYNIFSHVITYVYSYTFCKHIIYIIVNHNIELAQLSHIACKWVKHHRSYWITLSYWVVIYCIYNYYTYLLKCGYIAL